ncbi:MAG TPA: hypothetical protein ENN74_01800, partial [Firmicutes bacterium]|nr:hypothetical protein [Bacillota bacterium]
MQTITRLRPRNLLDMAHEVGAVRPGVGVNHGVQEYLARRSRRKPVTYDCPLEKRALERTLGVILFQDQVNQLAIDIAGFPPSEADRLRRAFGRKHNTELLENYRKRFLAGAAERGVEEETADRIFEKFTGQYMFPESHAFAFGVTAYQASWLKYYYPLEFFVAIFNQQPMGFYNLETLKEDAKRHGVKVLNPDINLSRDKCVIAEEPASINVSCSAYPDREGQASLPVRAAAGTEARATQGNEFAAFSSEQLCPAQCGLPLAGQPAPDSVGAKQSQSSSALGDEDCLTCLPVFPGLPFFPEVICREGPVPSGDFSPDRIGQASSALAATRGNVTFLLDSRFRGNDKPESGNDKPKNSQDNAPNGALRLGFLHVEGLGPAAAEAITNARKNGPFTSIGDFLERTGVLEEVALNLAGAGAFDSLQPNRRTVKWEIGLRYRPINTQLPLPLPVTQDIVPLQSLTDWERMREEYSILSLYPEGHIMQHLRPRFSKGFVTSRDIGSLRDNAAVKAAGMVIRRQRPRGKVVFITLEDEFGHIPCMVFG